MGKHSSKSGSIFGSTGGPGPAKPRKSRKPVDVTESSRRAPVGGQRPLSDPASRRRGSLEAAPARLKAERERRHARNKRIAAGIGIGAVLLLVLGAVGAFAYIKHIERTMQTTKIQRENLNVALKPAEPMKPYTVLLMGADYRRGDKAYRSDVIILAKIDPQQKKVWMLSIPRDTRAEIPGHGFSKINEAHFYGGEEHGPELAVRTVEKFTGVPINHYMEVNFRGFKDTVNALGGVWVDVPVEIDDWKAASHSYRHYAKHIDPGYQLLDGDHALTFVRSRDFPDADFTRIKHQQLFFRALADQIAQKENIARLPKVVSAVAPYIKTDMRLIDMIRTAQALKSAGSKNLYMASVKGEWRSPYVWPDQELKRKLVGDFKAGRSFEPTPTTTPSAQQQTKAPSAKKPSSIGVTVRNGSGIGGVAKQCSSILKAKDFSVGDVGNANQNVYKQTLVVYKKDRDAALMVASALPPGTKVVESRGMYSYDTEILVVVGKDWDVSKVPVAPVTTQ